MRTDQDKDEDWLEILRGKDVRGVEVPIAREAQAIRDAVRSVRNDESIPPFDDEQGLQTLLFRLRRERLAGGDTRKRWRLFAGFAAAASVVLMIGLLAVQRPIGPEGESVSRGMAPALQVLVGANPGKLVTEIRTEMETLGLKPEVTQKGDTFSVVAGWPEPADARHRDFLARYRLRAPDGNRLRLEVRPPGK